MQHHCHAITPQGVCQKLVPPKLFMCSTHWYNLTKILQKLVWRYYEPNQENTKRFSLEYHMVTEFCKLYVLAKELRKENKFITVDMMNKFREFNSRLIERGCNRDLYQYLVNHYDTEQARL
jgi:hypothetical protein